MRLDVRRLAAVDMWGTRGGRTRRRVIRAEFVVGAVGCTALGALAVASGTGWVLVVGTWLIGVGVNYVSLAVHAQALSRPGKLELELQGADLGRELRRAGRAQLWIAVPFAVAFAAVTAARRREPR